MAHDHTFDCRICGAHLDSQQELTKHNRECHTAQAGSGNQQNQQGRRDASSSPSSPPNDTGRSI